MSKQMDAIRILAESMPEASGVSSHYDRLDISEGVTAELCAELLIADAKAKRSVQLYIERGDIRGPMVVECVDAKVGRLSVTVRLVRAATPEDIIEYAEKMRRERAEKMRRERAGAEVVQLPRSAS